MPLLVGIGDRRVSGLAYFSNPSAPDSVSSNLGKLAGNTTRLSPKMMAQIWQFAQGFSIRIDEYLLNKASRLLVSEAA